MLESILLESMAREFGGVMRPVASSQSALIDPGNHLSARQFDRVSIDTRALNPGDLFVALKGERFDAHHFLDEAVSKGAGGLVIEARQEERIPSLFEGPVWLVEDTTLALGNLGSLRRCPGQVEMCKKTARVSGNPRDICTRLLLDRPFGQNLGSASMIQP